MTPPARRPGLGMLLRRSKSSELKKQRSKEQERQQNAIPNSPPRLPVLYNGAPAPQLGLGDRPDSLAIVSGRIDPTQMNRVAEPRPSMEPPRSAASSIPPPPPVPNGGFDPYPRTTSMTHRSRYSYASAISTINSPRRVRRRKDPTPFNVLIVGTTNCGKTSFLEFLKTALAPPSKKRAKAASPEQDEMPKPSPSGTFIPHYLETEIDGERVGLTLWDSEGLEKNVVDLQLREMASFIESKFEETFTEEMKVIRSPGVQDTHIHAVFLLLDPARLDRNIAAAKAAAANGHNTGLKYYNHSRIVGGLDEDLDLQVVRTLQGKTVVIPVITKADTVTTKHMNMLKKTVAESLKKAKLDPLEALAAADEDSEGDDSASNPDKIVEEDEEQDTRSPTCAPEGDSSSGNDTDLPIQGTNTPPTSKKRHSSRSPRRQQSPEDEEHEAESNEDEIPFLPMSVLSPDMYEPEVIGRQFPWGFADPYNEQHCDFVRLKETVFNEWRAELRELSREHWYESWRTSRLKVHGGKMAQ